MKKLICLLLGHKKTSHIDFAYGSLLREHTVCKRCGKEISFERCSQERAYELDEDEKCRFY